MQEDLKHESIPVHLVDVIVLIRLLDTLQAEVVGSIQDVTVFELLAWAKSKVVT